MQKNLKIALVIDNNFKINGGTEISTQNLLTFGQKEKVKWAVVSPYPLPPQIQAEEIILPGDINLPDSPYHIPSKKSLNTTITELKKIDPDWIVLTTPNFYMSTLFQNLPQTLKKRAMVLWRMQADITPAYLLMKVLGKNPGSRDYHKELIGLRSIMSKSVVKNIAISRSVSESLVRIGVNPEKIRVIPTQVGGEFSSVPRFNDSQVREKYLKPNEIGILGVGRLVAYKGWIWVIKMYGHLRKGINDLPADSYYKKIKISVAGGNTFKNSYFDYLQNLQTKVEEETKDSPKKNLVKIEWLGDTSWEVLEELYNAYDIGVMFMGKTEAFGRVTIEALSGGLPVIGNNICQSTVDIITNAPSKVGWLVDSPKKAAEIILDIMKEKESLYQLQQNASSYAQESFTLEKAEEAWWKAINS